MCLRFLKVAFCVILTSSFGASATPLRFCMDPDNPPFSNRAGRGFDNQIAILVAHSIHRDPVFVWARNGRGFLREQFNRGACDVLMGAPQNLRGVLTTTPYYRSSYVFVTRQQEHLPEALKGRKYYKPKGK